MGKLAEWCAGQPDWAVDAMQRAASCSQEFDADVDALVCRIGLAHGLTFDGDHACQPFTEESVVAVGASPDDVTLLSFGPLQGLDRLAGDQVLKFALDGITIVFGDNGSGKSGYTRALRQLTCVREDAPLEGDVFAVGNAPPKSITYTYCVGTGEAVTPTTRGRSYDFQLIPIPAVSTAPEIYFQNGLTGSYRYTTYSGSWVYNTANWRNDYSYLPPSGNIHVIDVITNSATSGTSNPGHPLGAVRCKVGNTTGVTCGTITASSTNTYKSDGTAMYGIVRVGNPTEQIMGFSGDSGAAVIDEPLWNYTYNRYEAKAGGILFQAPFQWVNPTNTQPNDEKRPCDTYRDQNCIFDYTPVDRINDFAPAQILIRTGATGVTSKTP